MLCLKEASTSSATHDVESYTMVCENRALSSITQTPRYTLFTPKMHARPGPQLYTSSLNRFHKAREMNGGPVCWSINPRLIINSLNHLNALMEKNSMNVTLLVRVQRGIHSKPCINVPKSKLETTFNQPSLSICAQDTQCRCFGFSTYSRSLEDMNQ